MKRVNGLDAPARSLLAAVLTHSDARCAWIFHSDNLHFTSPYPHYQLADSLGPLLSILPIPVGFSGIGSVLLTALGSVPSVLSGRHLTGSIGLVC